MPVQRLKSFLDEKGVHYDVLPHPQSFTAQETAASAHIPGKELAKSVMVKIDGNMAMVVVPAPDQVSLGRLKRITGARSVELATEDEFRDLFPQCEPGAMPPFGNLWGVPVFVDRRLREDELIAFTAGSHKELVRLPYSDFERLVGPAVAELTARA